MAEAPRVRTKHAELSLEEIAGALPGTGEVMRSVSHCFAMSWHAAQGRNWELAAYYLRRTRSLLRGLVITRPKYGTQLRDFDAHLLESAYQAILARDGGALEASFGKAIEEANRYHVDTGHPYIDWKMPDRPPEPGLSS